MNLEELRQMTEQGEGNRLEFKESLSDMKRILKTLCAYANTEGGTILVGVTDRGKIIGFPLGPRTESNLINIILDSIREPIAPEVEIISLDKSKAVIRLTVNGNPRAAHTVKGKPYWRVGSVSRLMPQREYENRIKEQQPTSWETVVVGNASESDIDLEAVNEYIGRYNKRLKEKLKLRTRDVMLTRHCAVEEGNELKPTRAGILLFGKEPQRFFMTSHLSLIRFGGNNVTGRVLDTRDLKGTLISMIDEAERYVLDHIDTMQQLLPGQAARQDILQYPRFAVRELIVNAVAHRDYAIFGSRIMIQMFRDRIEFHSPGGFPGDITPDTALNKQLTRNPAIAQVLHDLGYIERFGMGLDRVFEHVKDHPLKAELPSIQEIGELVIVTLHSPEEFLTPEPTMPEVIAELNPRQQKALTYVREHTCITSGEYAKMMRVDRKTAYNDLQDLASRGIVVKKGKRRGSRYLMIS